jgi:hypothetical protein
VQRRQHGDHDPGKGLIDHQGAPRGDDPPPLRITRAGLQAIGVETEDDAPEGATPAHTGATSADGRPRAWYRDLDKDLVAEEERFLAEKIYNGGHCRHEFIRIGDLVLGLIARRLAVGHRRRRSSERQGFWGFGRIKARRGGANLGCDGVRRQVRTRRSRKPSDCAPFGGSGANLSATGATVKFASQRIQNVRKSAAFRPSSATGGANCEPGFSGCR